MALTSWTYPIAHTITGSTKISETDNKIQAGLDDMTAWLNGTGAYSGTGFVTEANTQLTTNQATFDAQMVTWQSEIDAALSADYYNKVALDGGQLDNRYYTEAEVDSVISSHTHDGRYYTESEVDALLAGITGAVHNVSTSTPDATPITYTSDTEITFNGAIIPYDNTQTTVHVTFTALCSGAISTPNLQMGIGNQANDTGNSYILASCGLVVFNMSDTSGSDYIITSTVEFTVAELNSFTNACLKFRDGNGSANIIANTWKLLELKTVSF